MRQGKHTEALAVGCGVHFSGDRVDRPGPVVRTPIERGGPAAIIFEMLAERTLALAQLARPPEELSRLVVSEVGKWTRLTKEAGIEPE